MKNIITSIYNVLDRIMYGSTPQVPASSTSDTVTASPSPSVSLAKEVLDDFRKNVGRIPPETGGMLGSRESKEVVDLSFFDKSSTNTSSSFYYDPIALTEVYNAWTEQGFITNGIYHSHPLGCIRPSYHDLSTSLLLLRFFKLDYFYLPILQTNRKGLFTLYFYIVTIEGENVVVTLDHVLKANKEDDYTLLPFKQWETSKPIVELDAYRTASSKTEEETAPKEAAAPETKTEETTMMEKTTLVTETTAVTTTTDTITATNTEQTSDSTATVQEASTPNYFAKVRGLYPEEVLKKKVIICVGTGGARSYLENMARQGFQNFILIDKDVVSPSNIATQGVFISEMGKFKVDCIRDRILDINPQAHVACIKRFLDDTMSDEEFKGLMDIFPHRKPTDYLILGCSDSFEAQKRSSMLSLKYGTTYLAAMLYEGGAAAEIIFLYPGVTESCPRCLLRSRFEQYEAGYKNTVTSANCPIFATEYMNSLKGYITLMLLMYKEENNPLCHMLDHVKNRNFVWIRLVPNLQEALGISLFDKALSSSYFFFGEPAWIPQHPDSPAYGEEPCKMCGGTGDLTHLAIDWAKRDTRTITFN